MTGDIAQDSDHFVRYDCSDPVQRARGLDHAARAVRTGQLVVLPTDTVYGIGCDAFSPTAVRSLLRAKGRGPDMPVPVLIGSVDTLPALALGVDDVARELVSAFWPGALTLICRAQPSLHWDLGETFGTVGVRMPMHPVALDLLRAVGPMAVSSANRTGTPPAGTVEEAYAGLRSAVQVYLDGGAAPASVPSTIVDVTVVPPRVVRTGAIGIDQVRDVVPGIVTAQHSS